MSWHPNSNKHKAMHGGYKCKPSQKDVKALLDLYRGVSEKEFNSPSIRQEGGAQLKIEF